jgi:hypothetical protein
MRFAPDGTFLVAIMENDPLKMFFLRTTDGLLLGSKE